MKIDLKNLDASGFRLELPGDVATDVVEIAQARGLGGVYLHDDRRFRLEGLRADELSLSSLVWHLAAGRVVAQAATELCQPKVELDIPRGEAAQRRSTQGHITVAHLHNHDLGLELGDLRFAGELDLRELDLRLGTKSQPTVLLAAELGVPRGALVQGELALRFIALAGRELDLHHGAHATTLKLASLELSELALRSGGVELSASKLKLGKLRFVRTEAGHIELFVADAELEHVELTAPSVRLSADHVGLHGLAWVDGQLSVDRVTVGSSELGLRLDPSGEPAPPTSARQRARKPNLDLGFLDKLDGRIDVDVNVDAKVPYLKRRRATHRFRIAVKHGTLDYKKLEGDLSALEDALIDFAVRKGNLVLEVSPPLLSFVRKTIVEWPLDDEGRALADKRLVRIATLAQPKLPSKKSGASDDGGDASFSLDRLDFDPIDVELHLGGPAELDLGDLGRLHLGSARRAAVGKLRLRGELHHRAATVAKQPTSLVASATKLRLGLEEAQLGGKLLGVGEITLEELVEARVTAKGLSPSRVDAKLGELVLRHLSFG